MAEAGFFTITGAGDQGHMFGYATDETKELMPLTHVLATNIGYKLTEVRKNGTVPWLRPDGKTQVSVEYRKDNGAMVPIRVHTILISTQHSPGLPSTYCYLTCQGSVLYAMPESAVKC